MNKINRMWSKFASNAAVHLQINDSNCDAYQNLIDDWCEQIGEICDLEDFKFTKDQVFLEVQNWVCYRPGYVERYVEDADGRVWYLDNLNEDQAIEHLLTKQSLLKQVQAVVAAGTLGDENDE